MLADCLLRQVREGEFVTSLPFGHIHNSAVVAVRWESQLSIPAAASTLSDSWLLQAAAGAVFTLFSDADELFWVHGESGGRAGR
jgi:hypothetical protein